MCNYPTPLSPPIIPQVGYRTKFFLPVLQRVRVPVIPRPNPTNLGPPGVAFPKKTGGTPPNKRGFNFCNTRNCRYCPNLDKTGSIISSVTNKSYRAMSNVSCRSSNLIYCVTCQRCNNQYVGQTSLRLKARFVDKTDDQWKNISHRWTIEAQMT